MATLSHILRDPTAASGGDVGVVAAFIVPIVTMVSIPFASRRATTGWKSSALGRYGSYSRISISGRPLARHPDTACGSHCRERCGTSAGPNCRSQIFATAAGNCRAGRYRPASSPSCTTAVNQECGKVGPNCKLRTDELNTKVKELGELQKARGNTERLERAERESAEAQKGLDRLGPVPKVVDPTAARIAKVVGLIYDLGENGDLKVIEWFPSWIAVIAEVLTWGPRVSFMPEAQLAAAEMATAISRSRFAAVTAIPATLAPTSTPGTR
jgi:hypothetical protein